MLKVGDTLTVKNYEPVAKTTTPPKRLTQATLIEAMENIAKYIEDKELKTIMKDVKGIGMPSSRGKIIDDLIKAGYMIDKKSGGLYISESGKKYIENIQDFSVCKPELTAVWETKMQEIKEGSRSYDDTEKEMISFVKETVNEIQTKEIKKSPWNISKNETGSNCPLCGGKMLKSKYGWFCGNRKENGCLFSIPDEIGGKKITDTVKRQIIDNGISKEISGFTSKEGKTFSAKLKWNGERISYNFDTPEEMKKKHICPNCGKKIKDDKFNYISLFKGTGKIYQIEQDNGLYFTTINDCKVNCTTLIRLEPYYLKDLRGIIEQNNSICSMDFEYFSLESLARDEEDIAATFDFIHVSPNNETCQLKLATADLIITREDILMFIGADKKGSREDHILEIERLKKEIEEKQKIIDSLSLTNPKGRISSPQKQLFALLVKRCYSDIKSRNKLFDVINADLKSLEIRNDDISADTFYKLIDESNDIIKAIFPPKKS